MRIRMSHVVLSVLLMVVGLFTSFGGAHAVTSLPDSPERNEAAYWQTYLGQGVWCVPYHSTDPWVQFVTPNMVHVSAPPTGLKWKAIVLKSTSWHDVFVYPTDVEIDYTIKPTHLDVTGKALPISSLFECWIADPNATTTSSTTITTLPTTVLSNSTTSSSSSSTMVAESTTSSSTTTTLPTTTTTAPTTSTTSSTTTSTTELPTVVSVLPVQFFPTTTSTATTIVNEEPTVLLNPTVRTEVLGETLPRTGGFSRPLFVLSLVFMASGLAIRGRRRLRMWLARR